MNIVIIGLGLLIVGLSFWGLVAPQSVLNLVSSFERTASTKLRITAALVRVIFGLILIFGAPYTGYPSPVATLGWIILLIGLVLLFISNSAFERMLAFALEWLSPGKLRIGGIAGAVLGGLIVFWSL